MKRVLARNVRGLTAAAAVVAVGARSRIIAGKSGFTPVGEAACFPNDGMLTASPTVEPVRNIDSMDSEKAIELEGTIMMVLPGTMFRVALANDHLVLAHISGKMRKRFIRLTIGDRVRMEMSPYDTAKARIVYRL
jgi:translation initiation factor IF-1